MPARRTSLRADLLRIKIEFLRVPADPADRSLAIVNLRGPFPIRIAREPVTDRDRRVLPGARELSVQELLSGCRALQGDTSPDEEAVLTVAEEALAQLRAAREREGARHINGFSGGKIHGGED